MRFPLAVLAVLVGLASASVAGEPKTAYFADGYHGGIYGHYPAGYTGFIVVQLKANPDWKINLEIEPETWDVARASEPGAYQALKTILEDRSDAGRIEIVNPTYAQSYLFQASGESVIRKFDLGIRKTREHFPNVVVETYSSEEPCFTSCLPAVLKSFGFKYAVLKNPDTCWGGYTTARGGELVNWIGPDGSSILAVPRYTCESLQPGSCWQTIALKNSPQYLEACFGQGIEHPAGMCLQDAGWRGGPWLGRPAGDQRTPSKYITWRDYIRNVTSAKSDEDWRFTQEDLKPGLMWGAQVLQRIARQSREAEHRILVAEKLAAMAFVDAGRPSGAAAFDEAWRNVLLTQHHDCWIVPYNGRSGNTWADQVRRWTTLSNAVSDLSLERSLGALLGGGGGRGRRFVRLFNPMAATLDAVVPVSMPGMTRPSRWVSLGADGRRFATQVLSPETPGRAALLVRSAVPPLGYATVELRDDANATEAPLTAAKDEHTVVLESDLYRIEFDPAKGGTIRSLVAKSAGGREFVDVAHERRFNELRGHFYEEEAEDKAEDSHRILRRTALRRHPLSVYFVVAEIADVGASRRVVRPVAVGREGRVTGVGCHVTGNVGRGRGCACVRPSNVSPGCAGAVGRGLRRVVGARGSGAVVASTLAGWERTRGASDER
jgi:alpha-mannosidase